jgi:hypothetical protein
MAKLDNYLERKAVALADRKQDWTTNPEKAVATIKASSKVAGITGTRPTTMGNHHTIISDSAPALAGHSLGPTSPEMLLGDAPIPVVPRGEIRERRGAARRRSAVRRAGSATSPPFSAGLRRASPECSPIT